MNENINLRTQVNSIVQSNKTQKSFTISKIIECNPNVLRGIAMTVLSLVAIFLFLFLPVFDIGDESTSGSVYLLDLMDSLGRRGNFIYYISAMDVYSNRIIIPGIICWFIILIFTLWIGMLVLALISVFGLMKKDGKFVFTTYGTVFTVLQILFFILMITSNSFACRDIDGKRVVFYTVFSQTALLLISAFFSVLSIGIARVINKKNLRYLFKYGSLYLLLIIPAALVLVYNIYPMLLSLILSFKDYSYGTVWTMPWSGFSNFSRIFTDETIITAVFNTILISVCRMVLGIIPPLFLAIMLFDMGFKKLRKSIQMIIYIPHFFSWVIIYNVAYAFINKEGLLAGIFGEINILHNNGAFLPLLLVTDLWKECGWGTILYMAALTSVDTTLFEAASIDGAGPVKRLFKITIPCIMPTIVFVSVMAVGNLLKGAGYEQIMLFGAENMKMANVIDTWVIWNGLNNFEYGLGAAVSFIQALIGLAMVVFCNKLSKKWVGVGLY